MKLERKIRFNQNFVIGIFKVIEKQQVNMGSYFLKIICSEEDTPILVCIAFQLFCKSFIANPEYHFYNPNADLTSL